jgi:ribosomal protein S18 acetylase RimI-like enzyme
MIRSDGNLELRPMEVSDVPMALAIIRSYDEDDASEAYETYQQGVDGQFCLCENRTVLGVVGAKVIPNSDGAFGLSWTYLSQEHRRTGKGMRMLQWMVEIMKEQDGRKVFVHASDYVDPNAGDIYRDARDAYVQVGFTQELRQPDYYAPGESMLVYGMRLCPREVVNVVLNLDDIKLTDVDEIPETNDAYWLARDQATRFPKDRRRSARLGWPNDLHGLSVGCC